jgi:hypothetical protein
MRIRLFYSDQDRKRGVPWSLGEGCGEIFDTPGHHITTIRLDLGDPMDKVEVLKCRWPSKKNRPIMLGVWKRGTKFPALAEDRFEVGQALLSQLQPKDRATYGDRNAIYNAICTSLLDGYEDEPYKEEPSAPTGQ